MSAGGWWGWQGDSRRVVVHLHAAHGPCATVCGLSCDTVAVAYRGVNPGDVTCAACLAGGAS